MQQQFKAKKTGGKIEHMHLILNEKEYYIATKNNKATVYLLAKPPNIYPDFQSLTKDKHNKVQSPPTREQNKTTDKCLPHPRRNIEGDSTTDGSKH